MKLKFSVLGLVVGVMSLLVAGQAKADTVTTDATTNQPLSGYVFTANRDWRWYENGQLYTGFRNYFGANYYFINGVRQTNTWATEWGKTYYLGADGRSVEGHLVTINGITYDFGNDQTFYLRGKVSGYLKDGSAANGGYRWYDNGQLYTGFKFYMGTYYWFVDGVRQNAGWRSAWGMTYYTDANGRAVQGMQTIAGKQYYFGDNNTYYLRDNPVNTRQNKTKATANGYIYDGSALNGGYRWYENGQLYTGFKHYMGTYYWFVDGVRQNAGWRHAWGYTYYTDNQGRAVQGWQTINGIRYYFGDNGTFFMRYYLK